MLAGKVVALVAFMAAATAVAEVLSWGTSRLMAPGQGIDPAAWLTMDGFVAGLEDFGRAVLFLTGTAVFATMVGVLARSVPIRMGAALVWLGPIENIVGDSWDPGPRWFPGLLLRAVISPGSTGVSTTRALATLAVYRRSPSPSRPPPCAAATSRPDPSCTEAPARTGRPLSAVRSLRSR